MFIIKLLILIILQYATLVFAKSNNFSQCNIAKEAIFFKGMVLQYANYIDNKDIDKLPYSSDQLRELIKNTCIEVSETPTIDGRTLKDAINFYPILKRILLYRQVWNNKMASYGNWSEEDYYSVYSLIHHEVVTNFIKKSDPLYESSLNLYEYFNPKLNYKNLPMNQHWIYLQKEKTPNIGTFFGNNCALKVMFNSYIGSRPSSGNIEIVQNPESQTACIEAVTWMILRKESDRNASFVDMPNNYYVLDCNDRKPNNYDYLSDNYSEQIQQPLKCYNQALYQKGNTSEKVNLIDYNFNLYYDFSINILSEEEISIQYNLYTNFDKSKTNSANLNNKRFSFTNIYKKYKKINWENSNDSKEANINSLDGLYSDITKYPLQLWKVEVDHDSMEYACEKAKRASELKLKQICPVWLKLAMDDLNFSLYGIYGRTPFFKDYKNYNYTCHDQIKTTFLKYSMNYNVCYAISELIVTKNN